MASSLPRTWQFTKNGGHLQIHMPGPFEENAKVLLPRYPTWHKRWRSYWLCTSMATENWSHPAGFTASWNFIFWSLQLLPFSVLTAKPKSWNPSMMQVFPNGRKKPSFYFFAFPCFDESPPVENEQMNSVINKMSRWPTPKPKNSDLRPMAFGVTSPVCCE